MVKKRCFHELGGALVLLIVVLAFLPAVLADDLQVWQGQYYKGTQFQVGTFDFNFTVYDAARNGTACYSNLTTITTGQFGEWQTEQQGVGISCNDALKNYYLEITINGEVQKPRRLTKSFDYLRKDVSGIIKGDLKIDGSIGGINSSSMLKITDGFDVTLKPERNIFFNGTDRNMTKGVLRFYHKPIVPNTRAITFDIHSNGQENTSGIMVEYSPDGGSFYIIRHLTETGQYTWDNNADLHIRDIFGRFVGDLTNRITKLFVQDIDVNGTVNVTGNMTINNKKVCLGDGTNCRVDNPFDQSLNITDTVRFNGITVPNNATIEALIFKRHDAFGPAILLNNTADAIRIFAAPNISNPAHGAGIQVFGNSEGFFPGDVFIDAGSTSGGQIIMRTGSTELNNRIIVEDNGRVKITNFTGSGNDYVCVDANGYLFRSNTAC